MAFSPDSEFLSQTLSGLPMAVMLTDSDRVVRWVNAWFTKVTGYTVDDIVGRNAAILDAQLAADAEPTRAAEPGAQWKRRSLGLRKSGECYELEVAVGPAPGKATDLLVWILRDLTADGREPEAALNTGDLQTGRRYTELVEPTIPLAPIGNDLSAAMSFDITRQRKAEQLYSLISENSADVIWLYSLTEQRCVYISPSVWKLRGFTPDEVLKQSAAEALPPDAIRSAMAEMEERIAALGAGDETARVRTANVRFLRKDGTSVLTETVTTILSDEEGRATHIVAVSRDITERHRLEEALLQSEEKFSKLFYSSPAVTLLVDVQDGDRFLEVNAAFESFLGYRREEVIGRTTTHLGVWAVPAEQRELIEQLRATGKVFGRELHFRRKNGEVATGLVSAEMVELKGKTCVLATTIDITERKAAEEALRRSERKSSMIFQSSPAAKSLNDLEDGSRFVDVNEAFERVTGYRRDEVIGRTISEVGLWVDSSDANAANEQLRSTGRVRAFEHRFRKKNGEIGVGLLSVETLQIEGKRHAICANIVITERKRAEEALVQSNLRLQLAVASGKLGIWERDIQSGALVWNDRMYEMYGLANAGTPQSYEVWRAALHPDDRDRLTGAIEAALRGERQYDEEYRVIHPDGTVRYIKADGLVVRDAEGHPLRIIGLNRDVTEAQRVAEERERLQAQLVQAQKMESIGRLAGGVAHDFNNLLTVINGYSRMALSQMSTADPLYLYLDEILKAGERATALTRQLLAFSRKQVLQPRVLDLNAVVGEMRSILQRLVGEDVDVQFALVAESPMVHADPHQLQQVIMNLAVNSRDAMPEGGKLIVATGFVTRDADSKLCPEVPAGSCATLAVTDSGTGMDETTRLRIFEPFFTTKEIGKGTGLGLSMVQGIVMQSGGHIEVESKPGTGTTFRIYLPALAGAEADTPEPFAGPVLHGRETILVVEDQEEVRNLAVTVLRNFGYRVIPAAGAAEALIVCEQKGTPIDLVLTDVVMPHMSGRELVARIAGLRSGIKVLYMSGYTDDIGLRQQAAGDDAGFIQKPFAPEDLAGKIRAVLGVPVPAARILVADDDAGVRSFLCAVLKEARYAVSEAADGKQALREAAARPVDLVITDLVMPEQEGIETIRALRRDMSGVRIIAISGAFGGMFLQTARMLGADAVLEKPVTADALLDTVAEVLKSRR